MSTLNGVKYTEKFVTDEELKVIEAMRSGNDGCLECEGEKAISHGDFTLGIEEDDLVVNLRIENSNFRHEDALTVQITYCPFCGKKL